jgi:hypothetical protein
MMNESTAFDLARFTLSDMIQCGAGLRRLGAGASSMEEVGDRAVRFLYERLRSSQPAGPACALVRTFITQPFAKLESRQQEFAVRLTPDIRDHPATKCLTLLGTAGQLPEWNDRKQSAGHQALPLASEESVARSPMISQLIRQLGVEVSALLDRDSHVMVDDAEHSFNVFHVMDAVGSPHIPAQAEFVVPYGVRSVVGFGGLLPPGELFATILFSRIVIPRDVAELFRTLALNLKVALLPFVGDRVFS